MSATVFVFRMTFIAVMSSWWPWERTEHLGVMWHARPGSFCHQQLVSPAPIHFNNSYVCPPLSRAEHRWHIAEPANTTSQGALSSDKWTLFPPWYLLSFTQDFGRTQRILAEITQEKKSYPHSKLSPKIVPCGGGRPIRLTGILKGWGFVLKSTDWWNTLFLKP